MEPEIRCGCNGLSLSSLVALKVAYSVNASEKKTKQTKLHGLSPRANYTDRATSACRRSDCQLVRIECATWSA
jgi:hypothetical protein